MKGHKNIMRLLSLFSGIGAFEKALERCNINYELVNYCEIDKYASKAYSIIHNVDESKNLKDVTKIDASALPCDLDLITYGFPCVPKGYMIKVENGYKAIEDITDSDLVLTHTNTYKKVVKTMKRISDHIIHIKGAGCTDLQVTDEHPLYVLRNGEFTWVKAKDLNTETDYLCYNINNKAIPCDYSDAVLWLMGRYFADGYKENHSLHRPIFCIGKKKIEEFETCIKPFKFSIAHSERSAVEYKITDDYLCEILSSLTTGSTTKEIPQWIVDLPKQQLEAFYKGYFSGDGYGRKDRELYMFCTASKNMFLALQDIVIKLYNVVPTVSIRHDARKATYNDTYNVQYSYRPKDQIVKDNKVCVKIKDVIRELKDIEVFNFEVEEDNSYTVNNVIVHNCQDISVAGKQKGFTDENGDRTRSGLFFDALRIISATQPKFAIAENVKALTSKKFANEFKTVLTSLELAGYNNYYAVLNAKDYGIPQNRERVFIISIREDIDTGDFAFPTPFELKTRLKDLLEDEVDETYYLKDSLQFFINNSQEAKGNVDTLLVDDTQGFESEPRIYKEYSPTLRSSRQGLKIIQVCNLVTMNGDYKGSFDNPQRGRVYSTNGVCPTLNGMQGGGLEPKIITHNIKQQVKVRKYEVDTKKLVEVLREQKQKTGLTNKQLSEKLNLPLTKIEHWFRQDSSFAIPDADIWFELKKLLNIETNEFDLPITEFEEKEGVFEKSNRCYHEDGISPTLTSVSANEKIITKDRVKQIGNIVTTGTCGTTGVAVWGKNKQVDTNSYINEIISKNIEIPVAIDEQNVKVRTDGLVGTLMTDGSSPKKNNRICCADLRIRKLTPKECWRLMGFDDEDIDKCVAAGLSNSQLYKMAGNSIVVNCIEEIYKRLFKG